MREEPHQRKRERSEETRPQLLDQGVRLEEKEAEDDSGNLQSCLTLPDRGEEKKRRAREKQEDRIAEEDSGLLDQGSQTADEGKRQEFDPLSQPKGGEGLEGFRPQSSRRAAMHEEKFEAASEEMPLFPQFSRGISLAPAAVGRTMM